MTGGPLRQVESYIWCHDTLPDVTLPALSWWDGSFQYIEGKRYILVAEEYDAFREPDLELLSCGHIQPVRTWGRGHKTYNRRRRCIACALESS